MMTAKDKRESAQIIELMIGAKEKTREPPRR